MPQETITITLTDMEHIISEPLTPSMFLQQEQSMFLQQEQSMFVQQEQFMFVQQEQSMFVQQEQSMFVQQEPSMNLQQEDSMFLQQEPSMNLQQEDSAMDSITGKKTKRAKRLSSEKMIEEHNAAEGSNSKKLEHNAKERIRRMRLNASFLALRGLLPDSRKSKKRWSAPTIVDRVLKYIPEMETEIEKLKQVRDDHMQSASKNKESVDDQDPHSQLQGPTVSVTEVKKGEAIIQTCTRKDHGEFSNLLHNIEAEGISIKSASTLWICDDIVCYQLLIEMNNGSSHEHEPNTVSELRDKVLSWLS